MTNSRLYSDNVSNKEQMAELGRAQMNRNMQMAGAQQAAKDVDAAWRQKDALTSQAAYEQGVLDATGLSAMPTQAEQEYFNKLDAAQEKYDAINGGFSDEVMPLSQMQGE
jgi:hypothetical protein